MTGKITINGESHEIHIDSSKTWRVGSVSPSTKLYVISVPQDAMGDERIRITSDGSMFFKDDYGNVFGITDVEP